MGVHTILNFFQLATSTTDSTSKEHSSMPIPNPCTCRSLHNERCDGSSYKAKSSSPAAYRPVVDLYQSWAETAGDLSSLGHPHSSTNSPQASASHPESSCCTFLSTLWPTNVDQLKQARMLPAMGMRRLSHLIFDAGSDHIIRGHCERDVSSYNPEPHITIIRYPSVLGSRVSVACT